MDEKEKNYKYFLEVTTIHSYTRGVTLYQVTNGPFLTLQMGFREDPFIILGISFSPGESKSNISEPLPSHQLYIVCDLQACFEESY
ncbi:hypothetical protein CEXT_570821 [Caerostris extrusa]|uniref:Uncharacterized protein n=1 Tax=Caerostris extrusa TaxID=172846 RepID=A0AAV4MR42_CAEEX|nr:hypothetical protein CEXT_570821 [Caerostris extrusa]